jgi:hypothetical protein
VKRVELASVHVVQYVFLCLLGDVESVEVHVDEDVFLH